MKSILKKSLLTLPLAVWERVVPRSEVVVCYHMISDDHMPHVRHLFPYKTPGQFAADLSFLKLRYEIIDEGGLAKRIGAGKKGVTTVASITFDDGFTECYSVARQILNSSGVNATFFIVSECLDNKYLLYRHKASLCAEKVRSMNGEESQAVLKTFERICGAAFTDPESLVKFILGIRADRVDVLKETSDLLEVDEQAFLEKKEPYMTVAQVKRLAEDGHTIGAHGTNHYEFQLLDPKEMERQIVTSCEIVQHVTGRRPVPFAVPFRLDGLDRNVLAGIARRNPIVGMIYGTSGMKREPRGFFNRAVVDNPAGAFQGRSNLGHLLRRAYLGGLYEDVTRRLK